MKKIKTLSLVFIALVIMYTSILTLGNQSWGNSKLCQNILFRSIQPWDSTCFYSKAFNKTNLVTDLIYEKLKLEKFTKNNGLSPSIQWYRSVFFRQFRGVFEISNDKIDELHWQYTLSQPDALKNQITFFEYLADTQSLTQAQQSLDKYCSKYLTKERMSLAALIALERIANKSGLNLEFIYCTTLVK